MANEQQRRSPTKRKAMQKVRNDVFRGNVEKPSTCSSCGKSVPKSNLAGHHTDGYANKSTVKWLCHTCHQRANANTAGQSVN